MIADVTAGWDTRGLMAGHGCRRASLICLYFHNGVERVNGYLEVLAGQIEKRKCAMKTEAKGTTGPWVPKALAHKTQ